MKAEKLSNGTVTPWVIAEQLQYELKCSSLQSDKPSILYRALFCDIALSFPNFVRLDFTYLLSRRSKEGEQFYLDCLPRLGKAIETSLVTGEELIVPHGWKFQKDTKLPKFCYCLFTKLFQDNGQPRSKDSLHGEEGTWEAVKYLRQLTLLFSKVHKPCDASVKTDALKGFAERVSKEPTITVDPDILREARRLICHVVGRTGPASEELKEFCKDPWGRQGPGAVAGRERGSDKWYFHTWPGLSHSIFEWAQSKPCGVGTHFDEQPDARVVDVPKDFRGPRIICIEPKENQFAQQGLMDALYRTIERNHLSHRSINFWDTCQQTQNCTNSDLSTIDLSNASDTVSLALAKLIFPRWFYVLATRYRTRYVNIEGQRIKSRCLATMGNATCFPLETLVFWALSLGTLIVVKDSHRKSGRFLNMDCSVFGDDICVPLWGADAVCETLKAAGCTVNPGKTCLWTPIRESCGEWTWDGKSCKIARPHTLSVTDHRSWLQWQDLMTDLGDTLSPALKASMLDILDDFYIPKLRYNKTLQRVERLVPMFVQRGIHSELPAWSGLYAWQVGNDRTPFLSGARKRVVLRWQATYHCGM